MTAADPAITDPDITAPVAYRRRALVSCALNSLSF